MKHLCLLDEVDMDLKEKKRFERFRGFWNRGMRKKDYTI